MLRSTIVRLVALCTRHAWPTIALALVLAALCTVYSVQHFAVATDVKQLFPAELPWVQRAYQLLDTYPQHDVLAVVDDAALDLGDLRMREQGSHGGHNGLRSLIETMGTEEFPRVRVGIRRGELPDDLAEYVLSEFPEEDVLVVQEVVGRAAEAVECFLRDGPAAAMNRFNGPQKG